MQSPALRRQRQQDLKFKASWVIERVPYNVSKTNKMMRRATVRLF
jgi:hypothetical protein